MGPAILNEHVHGLACLAERGESSGQVAGGGGEARIERVVLPEVRERGAKVPAPLV
jgi:hypothetical protein